MGQIKGSDPLHTQGARMQADSYVFQRIVPDRTMFAPLRAFARSHTARLGAKFAWEL